LQGDGSEAGAATHKQARTQGGGMQGMHPHTRPKEMLT